MKRPQWDACPAEKPPRAGGAVPDSSQLRPGSRVTAFHGGHRVEVALEYRLEGEDAFEGRVERIDDDSEIAGEIGMGDRVAVPMARMCEIRDPDARVQS